MTDREPGRCPSQGRKETATMQLELWIRFDDRWRQYLYDQKDKDKLARDAANAIKAGYAIQVYQ